MKEITSSHNSLVKFIKSLHNKKGRKDSGAFLVEGIRNVKEALKSGASVEKLIVSDSRVKELEKIDDLIKEIEIVVISEKIFAEISNTVTPQGIALIASIPHVDINKIIGSKNNRLFVAIDSLQDPGNLGTIIRTCSAANVDAILIGKGNVDPYSPKVVRSTMGSIFQIPIVVNENLVETLKILKENKCYKIVTGHIAAEDYYFEEDLTGNNVIVIGNENKGPSLEILDISNKVVKIPLLGAAESLNASTAASILIYESVRQRIVAQG